MWLSFWRSRNRFTLEELRYLTDQLQKVQVVNEVNKDFVVEALRSIAELMTYGDQHDPSFFEFFMEKQLMDELVRVLKISRTISVSIQLLQTMGIMIQNIKHEHAIYYLFGNEQMNYLITYSFDFRNEEVLSYYISFLRAISGKLDKDTISLLVKTQNDEVVSFPLYVEAIKFAFHEENMVRIAVRTLTLNVFHVGDEGVNRYVTSGPLANYFCDFVKFFGEQCSSLNSLILQASKDDNEENSLGIIPVIDEIEDNLFYISDVVSAGIPDVDRLITDNMLRLLILPLLLPSLTDGVENGKHIGAVTSMYLLCSILRIVKIKTLANTIAAALFCPREAFVPTESKLNGGSVSSKIHHISDEGNYDQHTLVDSENLKVDLPDGAGLPNCHESTNLALREVLLSYLTRGNDAQVSSSLSVLSTLSQTKELDETMLDALGILPQRQQQKQLLLQALVGESSGEEQLFSSDAKEGYSSDLDYYVKKLKERFGISLSYLCQNSSPRLHKFQVLDALVNLVCRSDLSPEILWDGGWLLRQLLPCSPAEFNMQHLKLLRESFNNCSGGIRKEIRGVWIDQLVVVFSDAWRKCKKATEVPSRWKELKYVLLPSQKSRASAVIPSESSFSAGMKMCNLVKEFVLLYQLLTFFHGRPLPDHAPIYPPLNESENSRAKTVGLENLGPKPGSELKLVGAIPCRIAFERGKERHFNFLPVSVGVSGWLLLVEELPLKQSFGVVRVIAPLSGCNPTVDERHPRWLHLRIRPSTLPSVNAIKSAVASTKNSKPLVDGRWTLAFRDEESCRSALAMILEEISRQSEEVERRLKPLFDVDSAVDSLNSSSNPEVTTSNTIR